MTFSSQFNSTLGSDTVAIQSYINAVNNGSTTTQAFEMHMRGASTAAQTYVQSMNFAALSTDAYVQQAKMAEIATMAQNKSFTSVRSILNTYNTGLSEVGLSSQQFTQSVAQGNSVLGRYLANVGVGNATMRGYVGTLIAAKAATIGLRIAQTALNAAIGFGLGLVVQFVMSGIAKAFEAIKEACKSAEEKMSDLNTKFQEISSKAQETAKNFQQLKSSVADIAPRFAELSKGVDSFGNNISLTDEEYTEFLKLNNEIAEMFPELNMGFDSNGNAMLALTGSADTLEQSLLDLVEAQRKLANEEIAKQIPDQIEALKDYDELSEKTLKDYKDRLEAYQEAKDDLEQRHSQEAIDGAKKMYGDDWQSEMLLNDQNSTFSVTAQSIWGYSEEDKAAWRAMIDDFVSEDGLTIDWYKLLNSQEFQNRISGMEKYINDFEQKSKDKWKSLASYMNAWVQTDDIYNTLDDQMQKVVSQMVSNLEYGTDELDESEEIKKYIKDNILTPLQNASPEIKQAFSDMFSIGTDDKSTTEYIKKIKEKAKEIADNSDFTYDEVLKNTGFEDIIAEYEKSANSILNSLKDTYDGTDDDLKNKIYQLSPDDLTKAFDYIKDYGIKTWDDLESALHNKTFDIVVDFNSEKEGMDNFLTAVEESVSATGMSSDAIANLKSRYQDLEGYDASRLFEKTTGGIHLNTKALNELEDEYVKTQKTLIDNKLDGLVEQYNSLTKEIENCTDAEQLSGLYTQRDNVLQQINDTSELASQYAGLTSAYNKWLQAQNSADERDGYENIGKGYDSIKELIEQGWVADSEVTEYLDLLLSADQRTKDNIADFDKLTKKISGTNFSIMDFFQYDEDNNLVSDGLFNFLDTVKAKLGDEFVKIGEDGAYSFDFAGDKINKVADALGMSVESVQLLEQAMIDAGFDVIFDSTFSDIDNIKKGAKDCVSVLKELKEQGKIDSDIADFNFKTTNIEDAKTQIKQAKDLLTEFTNKDGTVNLELEGAKEAASILATLIYRKNDLENPTLMNIEVDTSDAASDIEYAIGLLQQFKDANSNLEVQTAMGLDTTEAQGKVDSLLSEMSKNTVITSDLSIDTSSVDTAVSTINALKPQVMVDAGLDASKITGFVPENKTATVTYEKDSTEVDKYNPPDFSRTVTFKKNSYEVDRYNPSNITRTVTYKIKTSGSAGAQGTAYAKGKWGTDNSGIALGGELGQELVVRNGRFFTIGDDSAEFFQYQKGDIIFNAEQTRQILANGKITNGAKRGVSYAEGTAFDSGSGGRRRTSGSSTHSAGSSSSSSSSKSSSSSSKSSSSDKSKDEKEPQIFDWIEIALSRIQRAIDNLSKKAESTFKKLSTRLSATNKKISKVNEEINLQQKAADRYMKEANNVGLSSALAKKVREGTIDINEYDEDTQKLIEDYQKWYEKALDCKDAIADLHEELASLYEDNFNNVKDDYENQLSLYEHLTNTYETGIDLLDAKGYMASTKYYAAMQNVEKKNISIRKKELADLEKQFSAAMNSGEIEKYSEAWYSMQNEINGVKEAIAESEVNLAEFAKTMREIEWERFDYIQERIEQITQEADFLIDIMSSKELYDDKGQLNNEGMATMGLHGQNYNVYMAQADQYAQEILDINKQIAKDPYNTELIARREELLGLQQDSIKAAEDEKQAIVDMVEEGINRELDALKELIDTYTDALDSAKNLYDYQNKVSEKADEIASLQKQLSAYKGDNSEETRATIQKLEVDLSKAQEDLAKTEYDQFITDQKKLLDELYTEYEDILNQRLDDVDALISDMIDQINLNADSINDTLVTTADSVGYTMSDNMQRIWDGSTNALDGVITKYGDKFDSQFTSVNSVLNSISVAVASMVSESDKQAAETVKDTTTTTEPSKPAATPKPTKPATTPKPKPTEKKVTVGGKINAKGAKIYSNSYGGGKQNQYFASDPIYTVLGENNGYWKVRYHKLSSGVTGWFKKGDVKAYKTGGLVDYTGLAQLDGTPGKPELVLNSKDTDNFIGLRDALRAMASQPLTMDKSYAGYAPAFSGLTDISGKLASVSGAVGNAGTTYGDFNITIPIDHVEDYNDFVTQLQRDPKFEQMIQAMTTDILDGGSPLSKYKYHW